MSLQRYMVTAVLFSIYWILTVVTMAPPEAEVQLQLPQILQHVPFPSKLELKDGPAARKADWESFQQIWSNYEIS